MKKISVYSFFAIGCLVVALLYMHSAYLMHSGNVKGAKTQRQITSTPSVSPSIIFTYNFATLSKNKATVVLPTSMPQSQQNNSKGLLVSLNNNTQTTPTTTPTSITTVTPTTNQTAVTITALPIVPAVSNQSPHGKVTLTFDDGLESAYKYAAPLLQEYGFAGTEYIPTSCIGSVNTCPENSSASYMTWSQVQSLQNIYHWEIGSHSVTTPLLSLETKSQIDNELSQSKQILQGYGLNVSSFATPYGDYNNLVLAEIAKYYTSQRPFQDVGYGIFPYNDYMLYDQQVQGGVTVTQVEKWINNAEKTNQWLVLTFHDILPKASTNPQDYEYSTSDFESILKYLKSQNISVVTASQGISTSNTNMFVNGNFKDGISDGWTTDSSNVVADNQDNGRYPDPTYSIKFTGGTSNVHLFSPTIKVNSNQTYVVKSFLNMVNKPINSGRFNYIIDEYDANGNWLNSKTYVYEQDAYVEEMTFAYTPSSQAISKIRLQFDVTANSNILAYLSEVQMFPEDVTATPPLNLIPNGNFDSGLSDGWTTDNAVNITFDNNNNGSSPSPATSISLVAGSTDSHLYSPEISVDYTKKYTIDSYLDLKSITSGALSFYIDEYDKNGTWVSGHNAKFVSNPYNGEIEISYIPSSNTVKYAKLQVVLPANSGITAYFDSAYWY